MSDFIKGLDAFKRKVERISDNARALDGTHQVPASELFSAAFMRTHSNLSSFEELVRVGGFENVEFEAIPDDDWENVVQRNTTFESWDAMRNAAVEEYARRQLMRGV
jgi:hypothetical protein